MTVPWIDASQSLEIAMEEIDSSGATFAAVLDSSRLVGVLTDGDIRRFLLAGGRLDSPCGDAANGEFTSVHVSASDEDIQARLKELEFVPIVDDDLRLVHVATRGQLRFVPLAGPTFGAEEARILSECIDSGWVSSRSRFVDEFETQFCHFTGARYGLAVSNGTTAIELALRALGVGSEDEVIVPNLTFGATANAVLNVGAFPRFVDVGEDDWAISPELLVDAITARTKAVILVHLYGQPGNLRKISEICNRHNLLLVEDCAEAIGSRFGSRHVGLFGDAGTFSFFANKTLTTGEGGFVLFRSEETFHTASLMRSHGLTPGPQGYYWHQLQGGNYRMTGLQASLGIAQLARVDTIVARKRAIAELYRHNLSGKVPLAFMSDVSGRFHSQWLVAPRIIGGHWTHRDTLVQYLASKGIESRPGFMPLHEMPPFHSFADGAGSFPVSRSISREIICLPSGASLTDSDILSVSQAIRQYFVDVGI